MNMLKYGLGLSCLASILALGTHCSRSVDPIEQVQPLAFAASVSVARPSASEMATTKEAIQRKRAKLVAGGGKRFDQPAEAQEFFFQQRLAAGATELPLQHLQAQLLEIRGRESARAALRGAGPPPGGVLGWTAIGPGNIGGRTRVIVIDPNNPQIMYASGVAGGVWKSLDAGASWNPTDDMMLNLAVCSLAMDPTDSNVLYAGTGEGFYGGPFLQGLGIFKSTDAGANWVQLPGTINVSPASAFYYVNKIVISPNDQNRIYAATRSGVWRSLDAGVTWSVVLGNPYEIAFTPQTNGCDVGCLDLVIRNDRNPDVLFASFGSNVQDGLYRSDDGGDSWVGYTTPTNQGRMTLALAPSNNDVLYLVMADNGTGGAWGQLVAVFRTDDGGGTFNSTLDFGHPFSAWLMSYVSIALGCFEHPVIYSQGWYDNIVAVDPVDPDIVWVGGINLYRSDNGGQTFGLSGYWFNYLLDPPPPNYIHPDQHMVAFHPDYDGTTNQIMYAGNDGGLFRTDNSRAATSDEACPFCPDDEPGCVIGPPPEILWASANNGYGVTQYYHGDSGKETDTFVGGAQDNGTSRVLAANTPDDWKMIYGGDGGYVAIDPTDAETIYLEIQGFPTIEKSTDGGETFEPAVNGITDTDGLFITPFEMDQADPNVIWTGGERPWRSTDAAGLWEVVGPDFAGPAQISAIAIAPSDSNVVYLGFNNGYVVRTTNGLDPSPTWTIFTSGLYGGWVSGMAVDPDDPDIAYLTYSNYGIPHVLRTINGGSDWTSIDGIAAAGVPDIPAHWVAVRPCDSQQLYVGTELGVFVSDDAGANWTPANNGLAHTVVESLDWQHYDTLVAFTHGRGAFAASLEPCACVTRDGDINGDGFVDLGDFADAAGCTNGPNIASAPSGCVPCDYANSDLDADGYADLKDFAEFAILFGAE